MVKSSEDCGERNEALLDHSDAKNSKKARLHPTKGQSGKSSCSVPTFGRESCELSLPANIGSLPETSFFFGTPTGMLPQGNIPKDKLKLGSELRDGAGRTPLKSADPLGELSDGVADRESRGVGTWASVLSAEE
jgi:hypothetical protein